MKLPAAALALALGVAGCASPPPRDPAAPISSEVYDGGITLAVIGTPLFAAMKATSCVVTTLLAATTSAGLALTDRPQREWERETLQEDTARNCGGPYWLRPAG